MYATVSLISYVNDSSDEQTKEDSNGAGDENEEDWQRHQKNASKKAKQFNFEEMLQQTRQHAVGSRIGAYESTSSDDIHSSDIHKHQKACQAEEQASEQFKELHVRDTKRLSGDDGSDETEPASSSTQLKQSSANGAKEDDSDDEFTVPLPEGFNRIESPVPKAVESSEKPIEVPNDDDEYVDFSEGVPIVELIPAACEAQLKHGAKPISALAFDHQGTRFVTGGYDYVVNIFEFQKMDLSLKPSRELTPCECHIINDLAFSANGEHLLVASGHAQLRVLDRQGKQWAETIRGDQYLVDLSNTKGHTGSVNACCWHPLIKNEFLTCADDGTLRIWSLDDFKEITRCINKQQKVIKTKNAGGKRTIPMTCTYSRDGKLVAAGCQDGSIQIWKHGHLYVSGKRSEAGYHHVMISKYDLAQATYQKYSIEFQVNTTYMNRKAHTRAVTSIQFSPNGQQLLSRSRKPHRYENRFLIKFSVDGTLKLWELKSFKQPILVKENLECDYPNTECGFSPHGEVVYTCTSTNPEEKIDGSVMFFDASNFELVYRIKFPKISCIRMVWHAKINQMLVALSDGTVRLYYDPANSVRGALECVKRPMRRQRQQEVVREEMLLSPLTLEMFQPRGEEGEEKEVTAWRLRKYLRMQDNKLRPEFRKPADMPMSGPSCGGRVAASGGTLHSYIAKQVGTKRNRDFLKDTDVRAAILRHAEEAEKHPYYVTKAYLKNQPVAIFQEKTTAPEEEEPDNELQPLYKIPKNL
ncbi:unnamed protein product [Anisakis simplex]|uniref:Uncharacterized protein n=1 Tax=Anisakis simplex TaxID=6269 RepID=A0A3P6QR93_ANISI|nr:unnamed protein product [Anisakis simplex]